METLVIGHLVKTNPIQTQSYLAPRFIWGLKTNLKKQSQSRLAPGPAPGVEKTKPIYKGSSQNDISGQNPVALI